LEEPWDLHRYVCVAVIPLIGTGIDALEAAADLERKSREAEFEMDNSTAELVRAALKRGHPNINPAVMMQFLPFARALGGNADNND
jgi:hypothetical protein